MPRLLLLTPTELTRDPRARRAATAARARGYEVAGACGQASGEEPVPLLGVAIRRAGPRGRFDPWRESGLGSPRREGGVVRELRGLYRLARLTASTVALVQAGRATGPADVVHANDLGTLPAGWLLARGWRARLVYDAHELYAEFDPDPPRLYRAVSTAIERALARRAAAVVTVSEALAAELERRLRLPRPPTIVLNAPEIDAREPAPSAADGGLRAIYQGSFGTGRSVRDLLDVARAAPTVHVTIRAVRIDPFLLRTEIATRGLAERVVVAEPLPPDRVTEGLRGFDVGLIFDRPVTRNGELSLPNKLFEYLMAGLAIVAPRLPGLAGLVEAEGVGLTCEPGDPRALGAALEQLAGDEALLAACRSRARALAVGRWNAEVQAAVLERVWAAE